MPIFSEKFSDFYSKLYGRLGYIPKLLKSIIKNDKNQTEQS